MATIIVRKRKSGLRYIAQVRLAGHTPVTKTFIRKSEAVRWGEDTEDRLRGGGFVGDAPAGDMLVAAALDRYLVQVSTGKKRSTWQRDNVSAGPLYKYLGRLTMAQIRPSVLAQYRDRRLETVGASSIRKEMALLSHLYRIAAAEWNLDVNNPVTGVRLPSLPPGRIRLLTDLEAGMLLDICKESRNIMLYPWVLIMLHTGMRPGEGAGLTWGQVDFGSGMIDLFDTKTERRRVPMTKSVITILLQIRPDDWSPEDFVFLPSQTSEYARQHPGQYFRESFKNAVDACGFDDFHMHDLRHTAASHLLMAGVDLRTLADILGHKTMQMVQRYTHLLDDHKLKAINLIDGLGKR